MLGQFQHMMHSQAFINGEWVSAKSGKTFSGTVCRNFKAITTKLFQRIRRLLTCLCTFVVVNPATQEIIANLPDMNQDDTEIAIQSAKKAFESWKNTTGKVLHTRI